MKKYIFIIILLVFVTALNQKSYAHCEIPCGIYHDELRIELLKEHFQTIEKSMNKINALQQAETIDYNQLVRWINNKEEHANKVQEIVSQYFLHQRIKIADTEDAVATKKYYEQLSLLHQLSVYAMNAKQTTDLSNVEKLNKSMEKFEIVYFEGKHRHTSAEEHKH